MYQLHLVSCNIEGEKHLFPRVLPFLEAQKPDIVCLQEVFECDMEDLALACGATHQYFVPMCRISQDNPHMSVRGVLGLGIQVKEAMKDRALLENISFHHEFYFQPGGMSVPTFFNNENPNAMARMIAWVKCTWQDKDYCLATTHFTWSADGQYTDEQARDCQNLLKVAVQLPPHILCGDFNSPRRPAENNVFAQLSHRYHDGIPPHYTTSIDGNLHKAGHLELVVDGLFAHPVYQVSEVKVLSNVSDHMAIDAWIGRR